MKKKLLYGIASVFLLLAVLITTANTSIDIYAGEDGLQGILVADNDVVLVAGDEDIPGVWRVQPITLTDGDEDITSVW